MTKAIYLKNSSVFDKTTRTPKLKLKFERNLIGQKTKNNIKKNEIIFDFSTIVEIYSINKLTVFLYEKQKKKGMKGKKNILHTDYDIKNLEICQK